MLERMIEKIGVDIGGVIIASVEADADTSFFGDNYLQTPEVPDAITILGHLNTQGRFAGNVHLVSKAGERTQQRTGEWLIGKGFQARTQIQEESIHFTTTRVGKVAIA
jgi:hypothetical protein